MPTPRQIQVQIKKDLVEKSRLVSTQITDSAMHILQNSNLVNTNLWPKNGFKAGYGIGCSVKDRIYYFCAIWDIYATPPTGHLQFNIHNTTLAREEKQVRALKLIYDNSIINDVYFQDLYPKSVILSLRFKFTINPTNQ